MTHTLLLILITLLLLDIIVCNGGCRPTKGGSRGRGGGYSHGKSSNYNHYRKGGYQNSCSGYRGTSSGTRNYGTVIKNYISSVNRPQSPRPIQIPKTTVINVIYKPEQQQQQIPVKIIQAQPIIQPVPFPVHVPVPIPPQPIPSNTNYNYDSSQYFSSSGSNTVPIVDTPSSYYVPPSPASQNYSPTFQNQGGFSNQQFNVRPPNFYPPPIPPVPSPPCAPCAPQAPNCPCCE